MNDEQAFKVFKKVRWCDVKEVDLCAFSIRHDAS
jgi:hypothetical protein